MKTTKVAIILLLLTGLTVSGVFAQSRAGDANGDSTVNIIDALMTAQYYVGISVSIDTNAADVNCLDGITIIDALMIAQYYVGLINQFPCGGDTGDWITPQAMTAKMGKGINMGNTLEAPQEGAWAAPAQAYFFDDYKAAGYTNVRIPIKWGNHIDGTGNIDPAFMSHAEEVVDWALARDLVVIINAHHENWVIENYWGTIKTLEWVWTQIAEAFADRSANLVFEIFNEPRDTMGTSECNDMNNRIISIIREKNPGRIIIIGGSGWGNYKQMLEISVPNDPYIMVQFHYYNPLAFTHEVNGYAQPTWGSASDWNTVQTEIAEAAAWGVRNNVQLYCGEFGVMHSNSQYYRDWASVLNWYTCVTESFLDHKIAFSVWDDEGWFGIYRRGARSFNEINSRLISAQ